MWSTRRGRRASPGSTAKALADKGVKVALFDLNATAGEALAAELGGVFCLVDVTKEESVDAGFAKKIATLMGVPDKNVFELASAKLTPQNVGAAMSAMHDRIKEGDKLFIYYSGHGTQMAARGMPLKGVVMNRVHAHVAMGDRHLERHELVEALAAHPRLAAEWREPLRERIDRVTGKRGS